MELLLGTSDSWAIAVVRITLGVIFFAHGAQKVLGWFGGYGLKGTTGYLTSRTSRWPWPAPSVAAARSGSTACSSGL
jgi:putative oxidoreductase